MRTNALTSALLCISAVALLLLAAPESVVRADAIELFKRANDAYSEAKRLEAAGERGEAIKKFQEAEALYNRILSEGTVNWAVLYNLGNAQYRLGKIGHAITNYRRAEMLAPRNPDIKANLKQARAEVQDKISIHQPHSFFRTLLFCYYSLNLNEATLLTLACYWLFAACIIGYIFLRARLLRNAGIALLLLLVYFGACTGVKIYKEVYVPRGTVVVEECPVRFGPGEEFDVRYKIHEGAEVVVLDERVGSEKRWLKVRPLVIIEESAGKETRAPAGWVRSEAVELF